MKNRKWILILILSFTININFVNAKTLEDGVYIISSALDNNKNLDVSEAKTNNGTNIQIYENNGNNAQKWKIQHVGNNYYVIKSMLNNNKCLDVKSGTYKNNNNIQLYDCNNSNAQKFYLKYVENGYFSIVAANNKFYVDVSQAKTANNTNVQLYQNNGNNAQKWKFTQIVTKNRSINDGEYTITSLLDSNKNLDVSEAKTANGTNVQLYQSNGNKAQNWKITYLNNGYYSIKTSLDDSKCLTVSNNNFIPYSNIEIRDCNNSDAQQFIIKYMENNSFSIITKINTVYLDVDGAKTANNTNVQIFYNNGNNAQKWIFTEVIKAEQVLEDGTYIISSALDNNKNLDVSEAKTINGTNVQIYQNNGNNAQKWKITYLNNGYYKIRSALNNNKCLDISGANFNVYNNIQLYDCNNSNAQMFIIKDIGNDYFSIITSKNTLYLDVDGAKTVNNTNVQLFYNNGNNAQKWKFTKLDTKNIEDGIYTINSSIDETKLVDVDGGKAIEGTNVQIYEQNKNNAQNWYIKKMSDGYYTIRSGLYSLFYLSADSATNKANIKISTKETLWELEYVTEDIYSIRLKDTNLYLTIESSTPNNNTNVYLTEYSNSKTQQFQILQNAINQNIYTLPNSYYKIQTQLNSNMLLDVDGAKKINGTNIQLYQNNGNNAQIWYLKYIDNGYYSITSALNPNTTLELANGNTSNGTNIQLYRSNNSDAQKWKLKDDGNGNISIISKKANICITVNNSATTNGTNIQANTCSNQNNQKFKLTRYIGTKTYTGIDVSQYQGTIDWSKVSSTNIGFVILRLGYGDNWTSQDDKKFITNVSELEKYNIPYGVYLYSYAKKTDGTTELNKDSESAVSEAAHTLRLLNSVSYKPNLKTSVYIDMEEESTQSLGKTQLTSIANKFCSIINSNGYGCGIYANKTWLNNYLDAKVLSNKYNIWLAEWITGTTYNQALSTKPTYNTTGYKLWQFSSSGIISGISGNVDMDLGYNIFD